MVDLRPNIILRNVIPSVVRSTQLIVVHLLAKRYDRSRLQPFSGRRIYKEKRGIFSLSLQIIIKRSHKITMAK